MVPPWMNESFTEALRTDLYDPEMTETERGSFSYLKLQTLIYV